MTVKVFKLDDLKTVFITSRAVGVVIENDRFILEIGVGILKEFDSSKFGCYVVA